MQVTIAVIELLLVGAVVLAGLCLFVVGPALRANTSLEVAAGFESVVAVGLGLLAYIVGALVHGLFDVLTDLSRRVFGAVWRLVAGRSLIWLEGDASERAIRLRLRFETIQT